MILIPELTRLDKSIVVELAKDLASHVASSKGVVILTSSAASAQRWSDIATVAQGDEVATAVSQLAAGPTGRPYASRIGTTASICLAIVAGY